jgi:hypothetical protein
LRQYYTWAKCRARTANNIRIFTADEGGSEHVQGDNRSHAANYVADWAADNF